MDGVNRLIVHLKNCRYCTHKDSDLVGAVEKSISSIHHYLQYLTKNGEIFVKYNRNPRCGTSRRIVCLSQEDLDAYTFPYVKPYRRNKIRLINPPGRPSGQAFRKMEVLLRHIQNVDEAAKHNNKRLSHYMNCSPRAVSYYLKMAEKYRYIKKTTHRSRTKDDLWLNRRTIILTDLGHHLLEV